MDGSAADNADLAERIQRGDSDAESELYQRFGVAVKQILLRATRNFAVAEELCQDTLIIVLKRLRTTPLEDPTRLPAFIAQTARNLALAERRKERRRRTDSGSHDLEEVADAETGKRTEAEIASSAEAVRTLLLELKSTRDRSLLVRYYLHDEDKDAICRDLGLSESGFNVVLFRARNRLRELLKKHGIGRADL
jgi:RNA polymerase sigma-70 factor (ECF subfamily)